MYIVKGSSYWSRGKAGTQVQRRKEEPHPWGWAVVVASDGSRQSWDISWKVESPGLVYRL